MTRRLVVAGACAIVAFVVGAAYAGALDALAGAALCAIGAAALHEHGRRLAGGVFGVAAAASIVVLPLLGIPYALPAYRSTYEHEALPALVGASHIGWFALGVAVVAAALFVPRPVFALAGIAALVAGIVVWGTSSLVDVKNGLHESGWSTTFAGWLVVAGILGTARRSPFAALGFGGWLALVVLRASHKPFDGGAFWAALAPAAPAAALLFVAIALLVPRLRPARLPADAR
jgi:hypothetical protein